MSASSFLTLNIFLTLVGPYSSSKFWWRNLHQRKPSAVRAWAAKVPKHPDLESLAFALEGAMVAYLMTGFFYDRLNGHWLYTILTLNMALHLLAKQNSDSPVWCGRSARGYPLPAGPIRGRRPRHQRRCVRKEGHG